LSLSLGVLVKDPASGEQRFARVKIPEGLPRFLPAGTRGVAVPIEDVIAWFLGRLFPEMEIVETAVFRVTRDADFEVSDEADDLLEAVRGELRRRRFGEVVRLEVSEEMSESMLDQIQAGVGAADSLVYTIDGRLDLADLSQLASFERPEHRYGPWIAPPQARLSGAAESGIFSEIRRGDVAIHLPYEPFTSTVEAFVKQASKDVHSIALKATVYRTSDESPLVPALIEAAEDGKQSVCLVELKAQFDEHRNITWSRRLDQAGVHVVYGFPHLKIHAKAVLVVRREGGHLRRYVHIGTGNYNSDTARLYEDLGLLTDDEDITADIADLFNYVTGFGSPRSFRKILVAPFGLRNRLIEEIRAAAGGGKKGRIFLKVNGLTDPAIIEELYRASAAGTRVQIVARSICTLKPKVPGLSDNIEVYSILGRFLEHSRLFIFDSGKKSTFFMGSADLMPRNLDQRIEVVVPVEDPKVQQDLEAFSEMWLSDRAHCWELGPTGTWKRLAPAKDQHGISSQELMMRRARTRAARRSPAKRRRLTPRPPAR
ncbi:MAG: polyphosphate kinase 1, partial [Actinomycetota bacterium]